MAGPVSGFSGMTSSIQGALIELQLPNILTIYIPYREPWENDIDPMSGCAQSMEPSLSFNMIFYQTSDPVIISQHRALVGKLRVEVRHYVAKTAKEVLACATRRAFASNDR